MHSGNPGQACIPRFVSAQVRIHRGSGPTFQPTRRRSSPPGRDACLSQICRPRFVSPEDFEPEIVRAAISGGYSFFLMSVPLTQLTLIARLRDPKDEAAWTHFETRYRELVVRFSMRQGLQAADAEDVAQAVFASLLKSLQNFTFDASKGRFRDYLFRAVRNEVCRQKSKALRPMSASPLLALSELSPSNDPGSADVGEAAKMFDDEWINHHYRLALSEIRRTHAPESVAIFETLIAGISIAATALRFATTEQAVHKVKQRVRDRMQALVQAQIAEEKS